MHTHIYIEYNQSMIVIIWISLSINKQIKKKIGLLAYKK